MKKPFTYCILRYSHDIFTGEFLNLGVLMLSPDYKFLRFLSTFKVSRLKGAFHEFDRKRFRAMAKFIDVRVADYREKLLSDLIFSKAYSAKEIARTIIPEDNSAFHWSDEGFGLTENPDETIENLYSRLISKYEGETKPQRDERVVWRVFQKEFEKKNISKHLVHKEFEYKNTKWDFEGWKNGIWHVYQPLSFDLQERQSIVEKALLWGGRVNRLKKSEPFKIYWLVGSPTRKELKPAFDEALDLLRDEVVGEKQLVREENAEKFSEEVALDMQKHSF